ncbi:hypothetical protein MRX96_012834 [Rhipicephalus microplus]
MASRPKSPYRDVEDHGARPLQHIDWSLEGAKDPDALLGEVSQVDYSFGQAVLFAEMTLKVSSSLRGLHIRDRITNEQKVGALLNAILRKPTLEELSFKDLALETDPYIHTWKQYLSSTTVLKNLSLCTSNWSLQIAVLEGVLENHSIEKLSLFMFKATEESVALVSRIIKEKRAMRSLSIVTSDDEPFELLSVYDCWVTPLIDNDTLEGLMLCSCILRTTRWSEFFRALIAKECLKTVRVSPTCDCSDMWTLCTELKDSGADEKVSLDYDADLTFEAELLHCKAISMVEFQPWECDDRFIAALRLLPNCQHLKTLSVDIQNDHMRLASALAEFLKSATALRIIRLRIRYFGLLDTRDQNLWWNIILESICRGRNAKYLFLEMPDMSMQDSKDFADLVKHSECVRKLCFMKSPKAINTAFFRRLSEGIQENYTIASVTFDGGVEEDGVSHWLAVKETTWRNSGLVTRAARIKQASQSDRYVTTAVDRVSRYPGLLDEVARKAKLDRAELEVLVRDRLRRIQSIDSFMRVVGVVKDRVICHPSDDGRMQLSDLNEDCWGYVRRYLVPDDVQYDTRV